MCTIIALLIIFFGDINWHFIKSTAMQIFNILLLPRITFLVVASRFKLLAKAYQVQ